METIILHFQRPHLMFDFEVAFLGLLHFIYLLLSGRTIEISLAQMTYWDHDRTDSRLVIAKFSYSSLNLSRTINYKGLNDLTSISRLEDNLLGQFSFIRARTLSTS